MIKIENLSKRFEDHQVLDGLNLEIKDGETLVIMGRSGCGKSVLLKLIMGLLPADNGTICIDGYEVTNLTEKQLGAVRRRFGMVFQSAALFDSLTVGENVGFGLSRHSHMTREEISQTVSEKLKMVGLGGIEELMPSDLSGGMRKRVSLARAISMEPEIILYDEPTTGLDPVTSGEINSLIIAMHDRLNVTSIVVTHDLKSAFTVGTRMTMLHNGKILATGTPEEFRNSPEPVVKQFLE